MKGGRMKTDALIQGWEHLPAGAWSCVLTIGNFDGVHLGHQLILRTARAIADSERLPCVAMTFEPPPDRILRPRDVPQRITPPGVKCELLRQAGADSAVLVETTAKFLAAPPERFVEEVVVGRVAARHVVEGENFFFGRGRAGGIQTLRQAGQERGFTVHSVPPVLLDIAGREERVSSSLVRRLVLAGRVEDATRCLGRAFTLYGCVVPGEGHGRLIEFPTANLEPDEQIVPADGVYAGLAEVDEARFPAAISIGNKPTLGPGRGRFIEAFLIGASGDYYNRRMALRFVARLRGQERFTGLKALREQIAEDVKRVREIVG